MHDGSARELDDCVACARGRNLTPRTFRTQPKRELPHLPIAIQSLLLRRHRHEPTRRRRPPLGMILARADPIPGPCDRALAEARPCAQGGEGGGVRAATAHGEPPHHPATPPKCRKGNDFGDIVVGYRRLEEGAATPQTLVEHRRRVPWHTESFALALTRPANARPNDGHAARASLRTRKSNQHSVHP